MAGRLDQDEFDQRMAAALAARTDRQLASLFTDLPASTAVVEGGGDRTPEQYAAQAAPVEAAPVEAAGRSSSMARFYGAASGVAFPLALIVCFATGWEHWWLVLIPMFLMPAIGQALGIHSRNDRQPRHRD